MIHKLLLPALAAAILSSVACGDDPQVDIPASTATNTPTVTPTPFVGEWERVSESADVLTGKESIGIGLRADTSSWADLLIQCNFNSAIERENGLDALIAWDEDLGSDYRPTVAVRLDDGDINEVPWSLSTDSKATLAPDADAFISSMKGASRLVARVWKQDQTTITAQWDVAGFRDAVKPIEERCDPNFVPSPTPTATITPTPTPEPTRVPSTPVPTLPPGAEVEEVDIANFQLADLEVKVGTVVIWTNTDRTLHTLTHVADEGGSALFNSGTISPSAGFRWHFTDPGVFQYQCLIHPVNMKAAVTVTK